MMGTNDTGYINKVAIGGHIALDTVLLISYVVGTFKGIQNTCLFCGDSSIHGYSGCGGTGNLF